MPDMGADQTLHLPETPPLGGQGTPERQQAPGAAVECFAPTKAFGRHLALDAIDLHVPQGSIFGFVGPNGAGKTTLLRILTGLSRATSGSVRLRGQDLRPDEPSIRRDIGYLPDVPAFYEWMTAAQALRFAGRLYGLTGRELNGRIREVLQLVRLEDTKQHIGKYSRGMRQRLGVAQALINSPRLLLLDEPTSALDPAGRKELLDFIVTLRGQTTVFFSTHILSDVERVCDHVAVLNKGKVLSQSTMEELHTRHGHQTLAVEVTDRADEVAREIAGSPWALSVYPGPGGEIMVRVSDTAAAQQGIPPLLARAGTGLVRLQSTGFSSYVIPGLLLAVVVGGLHSAAFILVLRHRHSAGLVTAAAGYSILVWIFVQMTLFPFSVLQVLYFGAGLAEIGLLLLVLDIARPFSGNSRQDQPRARGTAGTLGPVGPLWRPLGSRNERHENSA